LRQAYDYWQDQPGSIPHRRRRDSEPGRGGRGRRPIRRSFARSVERLFVVLRGQRPRTHTTFRTQETERQAAGRQPERPSYGDNGMGHAACAVRATPHRLPARGGGTWRPGDNSTDTVPRYGYPAQENQRRAGACPPQRMKRRGCDDVAARAGIHHAIRASRHSRVTAYACPATRALAPPPRMPGIDGRRGKTSTPKHAPLDTNGTEGAKPKGHSSDGTGDGSLVLRASLPG